MHTTCGVCRKTIIFDVRNMTLQARIEMKQSLEAVGWTLSPPMCSDECRSKVAKEVAPEENRLAS